MAGVCSKQQMLLSFHKMESDFFHRLVHDLAQDQTNMRWVMAFWLWLESDGHHDFIRRAYALPGPVVLRFVEEALVCLRCLSGETADSAADGDGRVRTLPCTNAFLATPIDDIGYFVARRAEVLKGVKSMYKNVCLVVCIGGAATYLPGKTGGSRAAPPKTSSPARAAPPTMEPPARAAQMMMSSPARAGHGQLMMNSPASAAQMMMNSPGSAAQMMMNSPGRAGPLMVSSPGLDTQMMFSSTARDAQMMFTSPGRDAQMMFTSPGGSDAQMMFTSPGRDAQMMFTSPGGSDAQMMFTLPGGDAQMMISSPGHVAPLVMSFPGHVGPLVVSSPALAPLTMPSSTLNPMASPWVPMQMQDALPEEYRSLFITFSKGYPIAEEDILEFFNMMFGPCVEMVTLQKVQPGELPIHGRMVLRSEVMIPVVLAGQQTAKFVINGRHLWARVYFPNSRFELEPSFDA